MLVEFTPLVIWVGSSELVDAIIDDGSTVDLVAYTFTVDIYKSSSYALINYGYVHEFIYKHTHTYHVISYDHQQIYTYY